AEEAATGLDSTAQADVRLAEQLSAAAASHHTGAKRAQGLRMEAAEVANRLAALGGTAAGDLAALMALRSRVAAMQQLLGEHSDAAADTAEQLRTIEYRPT
uniref:hypothetical protein n=1 Tax=uncultured Mycobacterium sp. TaxID=171292 RepID=UPI0035CAE425